MSIAIIDYGIGNVASIANMLQSASIPAVVTADPAVIAQSTRLIIAGIGAFDAGMERLHDRGLVPVLTDAVFEKKIPVLGICLGMQLMMQSSEEGQRDGLGWIAGRNVRIGRNPEAEPVKVPHMGWNVIKVRRESPLLDGLSGETRFYFAHSYSVACDNLDDVVADASYGGSFPVIVSHGHVCGVQFHPEKSHRYGRQLLRNFASMPF